MRLVMCRALVAQDDEQVHFISDFRKEIASKLGDHGPKWTQLEACKALMCGVLAFPLDVASLAPDALVNLYI